jgi:hypothetical protein
MEQTGKQAKKIILAGGKFFLGPGQPASIVCEHAMFGCSDDLFLPPGDKDTPDPFRIEILRQEHLPGFKAGIPEHPFQPVGQKDRLQGIEVLEQTGNHFGIIDPDITHDQGLKHGCLEQTGNNLHTTPFRSGDKGICYSIANQPEGGKPTLIPPKALAHAHVHFAPIQGAIHMSDLIQKRSNQGMFPEDTRGEQNPGEVHKLEQTAL